MILLLLGTNKLTKPHKKIVSSYGKYFIYLLIYLGLKEKIMKLRMFI